MDSSQKTFLAHLEEREKDITQRAALRDFFLQKMEQIPENWKLSFEKAKEHGDAKKMHIEGIKLETAQEIRNIFEEDIM